MRRASRASRGASGIWVLTLFVVVVAPGCSRFRQVGVAYQARDDLTFYIPLCGQDERVTDIRVETRVESDSWRVGEVLWAARPFQEPRRVTRAAVKAPLSGYDVYQRRSLVSLVNVYGDRPLRVTVETTSVTISTVFTIADLPPNGSVDFGLVDPAAVDSRDAAGFQERQCDPFPVPRAVSSALAALLAGSHIALAVYLFNSARHRRRLAGRRTAW